MKKIGFTIGKFAPLHKGHEYLIETALKETDELYVVIYDTDVTDISVEKRAKWITDRFNDVKIIYAYDSPKQYGLDDESVNIQMKYLVDVLGDEKPTHFYSSEKYGASVAKYMNLIDRRVDNDRKEVPISASIVREDLEKNKNWISNNVYKDCKID